MANKRLYYVSYILATVQLRLEMDLKQNLEDELTQQFYFMRKLPPESTVKWGEGKLSEYCCIVCLLRFRDEGAGWHKLLSCGESNWNVSVFDRWPINITVKCKLNSNKPDLHIGFKHQWHK